MRKHAIFGIAAVMLAMAGVIWASALGTGADAARSNGLISAADSFLPFRHLEPAW